MKNITNRTTIYTSINDNDGLIKTIIENCSLTPFDKGILLYL